MSHQFFFEEGQSLLADYHYSEAADLFQQCIEQAPAMSHYHLGFAESLLGLGKLAAAIHHLKQADLLEGKQEIRDKINQAQARLDKRSSIPGICFNSLHRSGTLFIHRSLARGLDIDEVHISAGVPLQYNVLILQLVERLHQGGAISQDHFLPNPLNLWSVKQYCDRMVVHIRDPRQAMLSSAIQMEAYRKKKPEVLKYEGFHQYWNPNYSTKEPLSTRLDKLIREEFSAWVHFIDAWVKASQTFPLKIMLTQHKVLKDDPQRFFQDILDFYDIPQNCFTFRNDLLSSEGSIMSEQPDLNSRNLHFRKGETDEWERVFSLEQKQFMRRMMPDYFFERFGWNNGF